MKKPSRILVTGGAGFIGSHCVDRLMKMGHFVRVVDNLSTGKPENVKSWSDNPRFEFLQVDLKDADATREVMKDIEAVFHLAANPEVRVEKVSPQVHFRENLLVTFNVLESMRENATAKLIVFSSSSTVYGEPLKLPTHEDYGPLVPISVYGASKLASESLISSYAHMFGIRGLVFRLANVVGGRSSHGVISDFVRKLLQNSKELEILGDGSQKKSYLHVDDCLNGIFLAFQNFLDKNMVFETYNLGSSDQVDVGRIAAIVAEEMRLENVRFRFTGGVEGGRGWAGDAKKMWLSVDKLVNEGWKPLFTSEEAVRRSCRELLQQVRTENANAP